MADYDQDGYIAARPLRPESWRSVAPDMPGGLILTPNTVPPGFLLAQAFLDAGACDAIVRECEALPGARHTVMESGDSGHPVQSAARSSEFIDVRDLSANVVEIVRHAFTRLVAPHFGKQIDWFELPEILRYPGGGEYKPHADADNWNSQTRQWERVLDRDLSVLIYLNEGYTGGEIQFPNFGLSLQPKRGLMIAFPSDARYVHAARPVTSGVRYALVSWAAVKGSPRVGDGPRPHAIRI